MDKSTDSQSDLSTAEFLDLIHGPNAKIFFQVGGKTWKDKPQSFRQAEKTLRWRNDQGDDIGFVVNTGGTTSASITKINAFWIDWDAGRDDSGQYHPLEVVTERKAEFRRSFLDPFQPLPSIVVETRNGFQVYWLAVPDVSVDMFLLVQDRLCVHFGSDPSVNRPCNVMRLPGFDWVKRASGLPRFPVWVVSVTPERYTAERLLEGLPVAESELTSDSAKKASTAAMGPITHHNKCSGVNTTALIVVSKHQEEPLTFPSMNETIEYLKSIDLPQHLGIAAHPSGKPQAILCPFHNDTAASATISRDATSGHWLFCCHSSSCHISGTLIDVTMKTLGTADPGVAIAHLMGVYGIRIESGWKERQKSILQTNVDLLVDTKGLAEKYQYLYRWIRGVLPHLRATLLLAKELVVSERLQCDGLPLFFISLRELERRMKGPDKTHFGRQGRFIDRYCLLGLLRKLPDASLPKETLQQARRHQTRGRLYRIQFYQFPEFTDEVIRRADERASRLIEAGASVQGVSKQMIRDLFGAELVEQVYPQSVGRSIGGGDALAAEVEKVASEQIAKDGYTTINRVLDAIVDPSRGLSVTQRRVARVLPGVMAKLGLRKVTCTKSLKDRLGITSCGFPKLILPVNLSPQKGM